MECINCNYHGSQFKALPDGMNQGHFVYKAVCPECGSDMVNASPGVMPDQLALVERHKQQTKGG